ncbi:MAG TPA: AgmX/PglI C-terminal domain-containing protein [Gammaproteobacteria bacterium]|nr:AgmX/PglI C-terminal domain-containing protein [Gammaproteobacteria bacterium]
MSTIQGAARERPEVGEAQALSQIGQEAGADAGSEAFAAFGRAPAHADIGQTQEKVGEAHKKIEGLEERLRAVDAELEACAAQREQYRLLDDVCNSLDKLASQGAADTFWGERAGEAQSHLEGARRRIEAFAHNVRGIEERRRAILDDIMQEHEVLALLEGDLLDLEEEEYQKSLEWNVERELGPLPDGPKLPWERGTDDDRRLRKSLAACLLSAALTSLLLPLIPLPLPEQVEEPEKVPERLVRLIELDRRPVPPPPVAKEPEPPKPTEEKPKEPDQKLAQQPKEEAPQPPPAPEPPRQRAEKAGILAFKDSFANIAERRPAAALGAQARIGNNAAASTGQPQRALITSNARGSSGGINTAAFSRNLGGDGGGGGALDGVEVGRVADTITGDGTGTRPDGSRSGDGALAGRTDEEIQIVFDRYKAALYRLYNRELRNDPTLRGQMVLRLTIEPDGSVSMCRLESSDMNAPALAEQVVERVKTFAFGAKDVAAVTIVYPIDFLPAA